MYIVVCEDNKKMQEYINKIIEDVIFDLSENVELKVKTFDCSCDELDDIIFNDECKIYIMDVELNGLESGTFIARKIREVDNYSKIIFVTSHDEELDNILYSYIEVVDFISKNSDFKNRLKGAIKKSFFSLMTPKKNHIIMLKDFNAYIHPVNMSDIVYIQTVSGTKNIMVHTKEKMITIRSTIKGIKKELNDEFVVVKSNTIINLNYIDKFCIGSNKEVYLKTGEVIKELSRSGIKGLGKLEL